MRIRTRLLAVLAAAATVAGVLSDTAHRTAEAAVPATIPLKITNNSGRGDAVYIYNLGTNLATGQQGWADASGNFHAWPAGGTPPTQAPDASIVGPANGQSTTIRMPKFSGRVYFSYGQKLVFKLTTGGLVQPAVQNPTDPTATLSSTGRNTRSTTAVCGSTAPRSTCSRRRTPSRSPPRTGARRPPATSSLAVTAPSTTGSATPPAAGAT